MVKENENSDKSVDDIADDDIINIYFKERLDTDEKKYKYLDILDSRIDENKKSMNRLLMIMLILSIAFPLILVTKIRDINIGPFTFNDNNFVLLTIPSIFAFCHYKAIHLQILLSDQIQYYQNLLSLTFNHNVNSLVNLFLRPYFFLRNSVGEHYSEKSKIIIKALNPIKVILALGILFLPYYFIFYSLNQIYMKFGFENTQEKFLFAIPIFFNILSILIKIQVLKRN